MIHRSLVDMFPRYSRKDASYHVWLRTERSIMHSGNGWAIVRLKVVNTISCMVESIIYQMIDKYVLVATATHPSCSSSSSKIRSHPSVEFSSLLSSMHKLLSMIYVLGIISYKD